MCSLLSDVIIYVIDVKIQSAHHIIMIESISSWHKPVNMSNIPCDPHFRKSNLAFIIAPFAVSMNTNKCVYTVSWKSLAV